MIHKILSIIISPLILQHYSRLGLKKMEPVPIFNSYKTINAMELPLISNIYPSIFSSFITLDGETDHCYALKKFFFTSQSMVALFV